MGGIIIALSVANTLLTALNHPLLKEAFLSLAYGNRLKKLKGTVTTVKSLLLDAANKGDELSEVDLDYIDKLKDAVYDADDLFDKLVTLANRKQLLDDDDNIFDKVRQLLPSVKASLKVKKLRSRLKDIADDHVRFGLLNSIDTQPHRRLRIETFSYVAAPTVVGRDDDARKVITMLLDSTKHVNFLTIVGVGGVGKTTLAKLVFGDTRINSAFDLKLWVCVSDQDGASLDVQGILVKILDVLGCKSDYSNSSIESLHVEYLRNVETKRLLLVLDDIWSESIIELNRLKELLMIDEGRSRIVATTRSMKMARIVGGGIHKLQGLSDDNSRKLFEMVAFGGSGSKPVNFVDIAKKIVKICFNVPLVIKVVGSLLYGQPIGIWQTFLTSRFAKFAKEENEIMSILKFSYDHLEPSLKSCFAYCAIFPKDYVISKKDLMELWEAQGYIVPFGRGQSIENAGEEHFSVLLQRCFFQDVKEDVYGDVVSFKIHDLMHDLAQRVSGNEICVITSNMDDLEYSVRHLSVRGSSTYFNSNCERKIRSHLVLQPKTDANIRVEDELLTFEIPKNWECLRALALQTKNVTRLPDTIGDLLHLRYLNLSRSGITKLPDSIVKLHNLQTLNMNHCKFLDEWPKEFSKLVNLTHLHINSCPKLSYMPVGMSKLSSITTLNKFMVKDESASGTQCVGQLKDLKAVALNLKGGIHIHIEGNFKSTQGYDWEGSCLEGAKHLDEVMISFSYFSLIKQKWGNDEEVVMEKLKPHPNLKGLHLSSYAGKKITRWGRAVQDNWATFLPNLVNIKLMHCHYLQELPMLSKLRHLKYLLLMALDSLEYIEEDVTSTSSSSVSVDDTIFFPYLETLHIMGLEKLKGWWKSSDYNNNITCELAFPKLSKLLIEGCPSVTNPSTNRYKIVTDDGFPGMVFGLGYSSSRDDYFVIGGNAVNTGYRLYSVKHNLWESVHYPSLFGPLTGVGLYETDALYWDVCDIPGSLIEFDLNTQVFYKISAGSANKRKRGQ
ncbi:disease resistance protein RGA2-like [Silene latifolia]|uniref:disease resistance protein RGA2-like n=1 Tax=Silene latifolia TaxID=37657 RepID=UPI003D7881D9